MSAFRDTGPQAAMIAGGRKLHLQHGPIDLIIEAWGAAEEVRDAYCQARSAFQTILTDLVEELPILRRPCADVATEVTGSVALRMDKAVRPHTGFITPMAAVAGSVADHVLDQLVRGRRLSRAYVNNGGDIALYLGDGKTFRLGVCVNPETGEQASTVTIGSGDGIGGVATSGWHGRSHSLGIADAVTVLASSAAAADAAATMIANAVDLPGSPSIKRCAATELSPDSDLGSRMVTVEVGALTPDQTSDALDSGEQLAREMVGRGLIRAAFLVLRGSLRVFGDGCRDLIGRDRQSIRLRNHDIPHLMRDPGQHTENERLSPGPRIGSGALLQ